MSQLYNRYINSDSFEPIPSQNMGNIGEESFSDIGQGSAEAAAEENAPAKGLNALKNMLGNNIKLPEFNGDTILLLVLVYFLIADPDDKISDTVLIIAALFLLGL